MTAREWLARLRFDCERIALLALLNAEGGEPSHVEAVGRSGTSDPTYAKAAARMAAEAINAYEFDILQDRIGRALRIMAEAADALGEPTAATVDMYYCTADRPTWDDVAEEMGCSSRLCYIRRDVFCDWLEDVHKDVL